MVSGWVIRSHIKSSANAETYRVAGPSGRFGFLKVFDTDRVPEDRRGQDGELLETVIMQLIGHPGVPTVRSTGTIGAGKRPYLLTDLVPGETLADRLAREVVLTSAQVSVVMRDLLGIVAHIHTLDNPVFHNELTPSNVLMGIRDGREDCATLIDFGHARRASDGPGRPPLEVDPYYLPSESFEGDRGSAAGDVFALGAICFRALYGMAPWAQSVGGMDRGDLTERLLRARRRPPRVAQRSHGGDVEPSLLVAMKKALSPMPDHRFCDAASFLEALDEEADGADTRWTSSSSASAPVGASVGGFTAVAGMAEVKGALTNDVLNLLKDPERYREFGLDIPSGVLLYGPPGCGKTYLAERFGEEIGFSFRKVSPSSLASIYVHGTQEKVGRLFESAKREAPCVLFLDEVDAMMPARDQGLHHSYANEVNEWLSQMNDCGAHGVFLVAATNQPCLLDPAVLRRGRFDRVFYVGPPDLEARKAMFEIHLGYRPTDGVIDLDKLATVTSGWVGSDIKFLVDEAARAALDTDSDCITMRHLTEVIARTEPSVGKTQIARYEAMRREFEAERGSGGLTTRPIGFGATVKKDG